jgi:hypothetical protein
MSPKAFSGLATPTYSCGCEKILSLMVCPHYRLHGAIVMSEAPLGLTREEPVDDPQLGNRRHQLITSAAQKLSEAGMIRFDQSTGSLVITDLGRIAAKYYIRHTSIEIFNKEFKPIMTEADVLAMLSMSTEVS